MFQERSDLLCDCDDATKVTGVNNKVSGCTLCYNTRVVDCINGWDIGYDGYDGKCWQWGWQTGSRMNGRHCEDD